MTREEALERLSEVSEKLGDDPEAAHSQADMILCELLRSLGYGDVVDAWDDMEKWYA
jgi:hypothetical protein